MITQKKLKSLLHYDPDTGVFTWKVYAGNGRIKPGTIAGCINKRILYRYIHIKGKLYAAHRLAFLYMVGEMPEEVDHENHIRDDNRWCNLKPVTKLKNSHNKKLSTRNTSGVMGVHWHNGHQRWKAVITHEGVKKYLGSFLRKQDAIDARKQAEVDFNFHSNHGAIL